MSTANEVTMSAQHEIELQVEHPTYRASAGDVECVRNSSPHTQFFLACTFYAAARAHEAALAELAAANARVKELEESFAFLQQQGTTDEDGDFVLHLVLSKHHSGLESAITAWAKREALAKGAA